jgi:superfamily II DNA or RNA helicase
MHFKIGNTYTEVVSDYKEGLQIINDWCLKEYEYYGMDFSQRPPRRVKKTDYLKYFQNKRFPTGWAGKFFRKYQDLDLEGGRGAYKKITWEDCRDKPPFSFPLEHTHIYPLRDYQQEAFEAALLQSRGIVYHATGAGKTVLMAKLLAELNLPSLIIVPSLNLLLQTSGDLIGFLGEENVGTIGEGVFEPSKFTVATVQSIWSKMKNNDEDTKKLFKSLHCLFIDEAHHINVAGRNKIQNTYFQIAQVCNTYYRFGLTATPGEEGELERELLEGATGSVIHTISSSHLIRLGLLTRPVIEMYKITPPMRISDYQAAYRENILKNAKRNAAVVRLANKYAKEGNSVLIIVNRVQEHGSVLKDLIPESVFMSGNTAGSDRKEIFEDFANKDIKVLISTVVNEGVNIPSMDVIIMAGGGKSNKQTIQRVGRALRKSKGKHIARIIDFYDADNGMLERHSKARMTTYKKEREFEIKPINKELDNNEIRRLPI